MIQRASSSSVCETELMDRCPTLTPTFIRFGFQPGGGDVTLPDGTKGSTKVQM